MIIIVYGEDTFRASQKVQQLKKAFKEKYDPTGLNTQDFLAKETKAPQIFSAVLSLPFLGTKRLVVIRDLISGIKKPDVKPWTEGVTRIPDSTIVIFWESEAQKTIEKKPLFEVVSKFPDVLLYPFAELSRTALSKWMKDTIQSYGGGITAEALQELSIRVGGNLWRANQEITKLVARSSGGEITTEIVQEMVKGEFESQIFELVDLICQRKIKQAIQKLEEERWSGSDDHYILTMLGRQVRILLCARALLDVSPQVQKQALVDALDIHPFVAQKALLQAKAFSGEELKTIHQFLYEADRELKSGKTTVQASVDIVTSMLIRKSH